MPENETAPRRSWLRGLIVALATLLFLIPAGYVGLQVYLSLRRTYRTEIAIAYTMAESVTLHGVAAFDAVPVAGGGDLGYLVPDGERVTGGTVLAERYTDADQGILREQLDRLDQTISLLSRSQNTSGGDISQLTNQTHQALYALLDALDSGVYSTTGEAGDEFLLAQNRLQVRTGQTGDFSAVLAQLQEQRQGIEDSLASLETVTADTNGYFVCAETAAGLAVDHTALEEMDPASLQALLDGGVPRSEETVAGRIVTGFTWWFYATCPMDTAARFDGLRQVQLSVPGKVNEPQTARILRIDTDEAAGVAELVLECESINAEVLRLGEEDARIDLRTYEGIRVDREAMHIVGGERGVYVKYGDLQRFRRITILYENDNYLLVPADGALGTDNEVRLYDEIIVEGTNLEDKKLL